MKTLFLTNTLNFRGTTNAIADYAKYNQEILNNESIITYNESIPYEKDMGNEEYVIQTLKQSFNVTPHNPGNLLNVIEENKIDIVYRLGSGDKDICPLPIDNVYHAVFQFKNEWITGYVSKWLSDMMTSGDIPFVPHIVDLPPPTKSYRKAFNIPEDAILIGRHGGYTTFDIEFVKEFISNYDNPNVYFMFVNTKPFCSHPRVIHIGPVFEKQKLSNFIHSCDAMLHARQRGESFGMSIAEFLFHNKPVIAWNGGLDKNHIEMIGNYRTLYNNSTQLKNLIENCKDFNYNWKDAVEEYSPETVMKKFKEVFYDWTETRLN